MTDRQLYGGELLKLRRETLGLRMKDAGSRAEPPLEPGYLSQIENGHVNYPNIRLLNRLSQAYDMSIVEILGAYEVDVQIDPVLQQRDVAMRIGEEVLRLPDVKQELILGYVRFLNSQA